MPNMTKQFSLINIEDKLKSYRRFAGCSGIVLVWKGQLYSYPMDLKPRISEPIDLRRISDLKMTLGGKGQTVDASLSDGVLILVNPDKSMNEHMLNFLGKEMEDSLRLATTFDTIFQAGKAISSDLRLEPLLNKIMSLSEEILDVEVSSVILLDQDKGNLYWEISRGKGSEFFQHNMTMPSCEGIAGAVLSEGEPVLLNDVHKDPRWCPSYDLESGFSTRSMICVPVKSHGRILGVIEVINKRKGKFSSRDLRILESIAAQAGSAIENARIYGELENAFKELKALDKARKKVINHLSHEIKTPLAILSGVMEKVSRDLNRIRLRSLDKALDRGKRNLNRLFSIQDKIEDIIDYKPVEEERSMVNIIENAAALVDEMRDEAQDQHAEILESLSGRIRSLFETDEICMEEISLQEFMDQVCDEAIFLMGKRNLDIARRFERDVVLIMDRKVLKKVFSGLLRNAIENTPDQGKIEVSSYSEEGHISVEVRDYGMGITPHNQKMIFGGFIHTQDTEFYASRKPYEFNAGGAGADLLRTKVFSERFGFSLNFESNRCAFIPHDENVCPGRIENCKFIEDKTGCLSSGGSSFLIKFPKVIFGNK